jgi:hypothetical protein
VIRRVLRAIVAPRKRSWIVLVLGVLAIVAWQRGIGWDKLNRRPDRSFAGRSNQRVVPKWQVTASRGAQAEAVFFFFEYHLGLYPLATDLPILNDSDEEAERLLHANPAKLKQEEGLTLRSGEHGRTFLYWVDAIWHDRSIDPSLRPATALAFVSSLVLLFASCWWIGLPLLGALLVMLLGSHVMQLHAVYAEENFFAWPITTLCLLLAVHVPLLVQRPRPRKWIWIAPVLAGLVLACVRTIRSEPGTLALSVMIVYATIHGASWRRRVTAMAIFLLTMYGGDRVYRSALEAKMQHTREVLVSVGGTPYGGPTRYHHEFWHAIWCGLGDFGEDHGYKWDDHAAYAVVVPRLQEKAGNTLGVTSTKGWFTTQMYDQNPHYRVGIWELPGYDETIRDLVVTDIREHPGWYAGILWKRIERIATKTTPVSVALQNWRWTSDGDDDSGPLSIGLFGLLLVFRRWFWAKLLLFSLPLSLPAFLVYSGAGMTNYSCFHLVGIAIIGTLAIGLLASLARGTITHKPV